MNQEERGNEKLLRLWQSLLWCAVVMLVMYLFVRNFILPQSDRTLETSMNTMAHNFGERLALIHNFWLHDNRRKNLKVPSWVNLYAGADESKLGFNPSRVIFVMSPQGWPKDVRGIPGDSQDPCRLIWLSLLGRDESLFITNVKVVAEPAKNECVFTTSISGFVYNYSDGSVNGFLAE